MKACSVRLERLAMLITPNNGLINIVEDSVDVASAPAPHPAFEPAYVPEALESEVDDEALIDALVDVAEVESGDI